MPRFLALVLAPLLGCAAAPEPKPAPPPAPADCSQEARAAEQARPAGGIDAAAAVFAHAECEAARHGDGTLVLALYAEAAKLAPGKFGIGAAVRRGDVLAAAGKGGEATGAYDEALRLASDAGMDVRMDTEVAEWIKHACASIKEEEPRPICKPWGGAWR